MNHFEDDSYYLTQSPHAPATTDKELFRMRELWRPEVQAGYRPYYSFNGSDNARRPIDYDETLYSMIWDQHMYVVPPAIAGPVVSEITEEFDREADFESYDDSNNGRSLLVNRAYRFINRFFDLSEGLEETVAHHKGALEVNFEDHHRVPRCVNGWIEPIVRVEAPIIERNIKYKNERTNPSRAVQRLANRWDYDHREGAFGWSIPVSEKTTEDLVSSLLFLDGSIINVEWCNPPEEAVLQFTFTLPKLSAAGLAKYLNLIKEHEYLLPEGVDYEEKYEYFPRLTRNQETPSDIWHYTSEQKQKRYGYKPVIADSNKAVLVGT